MPWTSCQTTGTGVCLIMFALFNAVKLLIDGDSATNPDWNITLAEIMTGIGLFFARDNNKTSEMVGAGKAGK